MSGNQLTDKSGDKKYFVITPQLVLNRCRTPYDLALWTVVKMIAGDDGECFICTEDLATLSMMSMGKVSECRQYLIECGLLDGEIRKDPSYPQPVWRLRIPDLWAENVAWRQNHDMLLDRVILKERQKAERDAIKAAKKAEKSNESLHQVKPSPGEEGPPPGEEGPPPGETKKNQKKNQKEEHGYVFWENVLMILHGQMTRDTFAWFDNTQAIEQVDGRLVVACPTDKSRAWLDSRLRGTVERAVEFAHGEPLELEFVFME